MLSAKNAVLGLTILAALKDVFADDNILAEIDNGTDTGNFFQPDIEKYCTLEVACEGPSGPRIPLHLPRGKDGLPGYDGMPGLRGPPGPPGTVTGGAQSAFMVSLKKHRYPADYRSNPDVIVYDHVVTNYGENYNATDGHYTAEKSGVYSFSLTFAAHKRNDAAGELWVSDREAFVGRVWARSKPEWTMASNTFILHLKEKTKVWVKPVASDSSHYYGNYYCTFTGHALFYE